MTDYISVPMSYGTLTGLPSRLTLRFKEDAYGFTQYFQLFDSDGNEVDLTGGTFVWRVRTAGTASAAIFNGTMTIETATDGKCYYAPISTNFSTAGSYVSEIRASWYNKLLVSPLIGIIVDRGLEA